MTSWRCKPEEGLAGVMAKGLSGGGGKSKRRRGTGRAGASREEMLRLSEPRPEGSCSERRRCLDRRPAEVTSQERQHGQHDENEKHDLRRAHRRAGQRGEAEQRR